MRVHVTFDLYVPEGTEEAHITEWLRFELGENGSMSGQNPLCDKELEAKNVDWDER